MLDSFIEEGTKKLTIIRESVLMPTKNREERKARVNKYLQWVRDSLLYIFFSSWGGKSPRSEMITCRTGVIVLRFNLQASAKRESRAIGIRTRFFSA